MKKFVITAITAIVTVMSIGCGGNTGDTITVISREGSSGTRGSFAEIMGVIDQNGVDLTTPRAEETQSNNVMMTSVSGNVNAIGYVSLGSLSDTVKTVKVDGVYPTAENIKNGAYKVSRAFNIVYGGGIGEAAKDFIKYIKSAAGQRIIENEGYIGVNNTPEQYISSDVSGKIIIDGSTSVGPVMEKLADEYKRLNGKVTVEIQQTGSSAGISSAASGVCDIGMSSRELRDSELSRGITVERIALDGIAVIVNKDSGVDNLTSEEIRRIYMGEVTSWSQITAK